MLLPQIFIGGMLQDLISEIPAVVNEVSGDITPKEIISGNFEIFDNSIFLHYQKWSLWRVSMVRSQYAVLIKILILMAHFFLKNICLKNF